MPNNTCIWAPFEVFYIHSILFNTSSALQSYNLALQLIEQLELGRDENSSNMEGMLLDMLQNIIVQSACISRYFWPARPGVKGNNIHTNRAEFLKRSLNVQEQSPLKDRRLRNSLEHFDERLDLYLSGGIVGNIFPSLITSKKLDTEGIPCHIFRAFYIEDFMFEILGNSYSLIPIVDEIRRIHNILIECNMNGGRLTGSQ